MRRKSWHLLCSVLLAFALGGCAQAPALPEQLPKLTLHVLNVGKADCMLLECDGRFILVDAGLNATEEQVLDYLSERGVQRLDAIVGTHPDKDHIGGIDAILREFPTEQLLLSPVTVDSKPYRTMIEAATETNTPVGTITAGKTWEWAQMRLTALAPGPRALAAGGENEGSVVLLIEHGQTRMLLMADAQTVSEQEILSLNTNIRADVLKIGHHGSSKSTSLELLKAVQPQYAVISTGYKKDEELPDPTILQRLEEMKIEIYRTDLHGTIRIESDGKTITILPDSSGA